MDSIVVYFDDVRSVQTTMFRYLLENRTTWTSATPSSVSVKLILS